LRNPWGGTEWNGDWSDKSELWTPRIKNVCGVKELVEDGIFWMDFSDFCEEFDEIYICRNYS
jgi:calpain-15